MQWVRHRALFEGRAPGLQPRLATLASGLRAQRPYAYTPFSFRNITTAWPSQNRKGVPITMRNLSDELGQRRRRSVYTGRSKTASKCVWCFFSEPSLFLAAFVFRRIKKTDFNLQKKNYVTGLNGPLERYLPGVTRPTDVVCTVFLFFFFT